MAAAKCFALLLLAMAVEGTHAQYTSSSVIVGDNTGNGGKRFKEEGPESPDHLMEAFKVFDINRDGYISSEELQQILHNLGLGAGRDLDNCEIMISKFDLDSTGNPRRQRKKNWIPLGTGVDRVMPLEIPLLVSSTKFLSTLHANVLVGIRLNKPTGHTYCFATYFPTMAPSVTFTKFLAFAFIILVCSFKKSAHHNDGNTRKRLVDSPD